MSTVTGTPQMQLVESETAILVDRDAQMLAMYNMINPATAAGASQDAIGVIYSITRLAPLSSVVTLLCRGLQGTYIPGKNDPGGGALARSERGDIFTCSTGGTIPAEGFILLGFESLVKAEIPVNTGTVNIIHKQLPGWDSCNNPEAGTVGRSVEGRADFERRRQLSVAKNSRSMEGSVFAGVFEVEGVTSCIVRQNRKSVPAYIGSVELIENSAFICVAGGNDEDVALAIQTAVSGGCNYNGEDDPNGVTVPIVDEISGAPDPVTFLRPVSVPARISVNADGSGIANPVQTIRDIVYNNFYGLDDLNPRVGIGETTYSARFYMALAKNGINVISVRLAGPSGDYSDVLQTEINQIATLAPEDIDVSLV